MSPYPREVVMFCIACAAPNPAAARHCRACGAALDGRGGSGNRPPRDRRRRRAIHLLSLVPLVALCVAGATAGVRYRGEQATLAAAYARAETAVAAGQFDLALVAYGDAAGYRDADTRREDVAATLAPYHAAYLDGIAALEAGEYDRAVAALAPIVRDLPAYGDAPLLLAEARERRTEDLAYEAEQAASRRDWLAAERYLATLLVEDPDNAALATRLADLRREHAPILFTRDHALYLVGPDADDERLVTADVLASMPVWSPDRTLIAFVGQRPQDLSGDNRLYVVAPDGTGLRNIAGFVDASRTPAWSPDGRTIAFTAQEPFDGPFGRAVFSVRTVDVVSGEIGDITSRRLRYASAPAWSQTGDHLAFVGLEKAIRPAEHPGAAGGEVYQFTVATEELVPLGRGRLPDATLVAWCPTDDRILVYGQRPATFRQEAQSTIRLLDLPTDEVTEIHAGDEMVMPPVWSPDGSRFAFVEGANVVYVGRPDSRGETILNIRDPVSGDLAWSPDGSTLLAAAADPSEPSYFVQLGPNLGQQEPFPLVYDPLPYTGPPQWSPMHPAPIPGPATVGGTAWDVVTSS